MKHIFLTTALACAGSLALAGCASDTNVSVNANSNRGMANANTNAYNNNNSSTMGSAMNTMGNAANSVSNSVSNMTGSNDPNSFLTEAAQGGMMEVELGKIASQKAQSPEVKKFGQMMVTDHTAANNELKALAAKKNVQVPADMGSHKSDVDSMSKLTGAEFDKEYVEMMEDDHEEDVSKFQKQADSSTDPDVKAFAMKTLPTLKKHLEAIKAIKAKMK